MKQFVLTSSMGKRLIGRAMAAHPAVRSALDTGTLVIVAGTTNGYVAEEVLRAIGQAEGFSRKGFRRGMTPPPGFDASSVQADFPGDVVLVRGQWLKDREIFDVVDDLAAGDVILKGANAVNICTRQAGVYIGHPQGGTIAAAVSAVIGRRVRLIVPVGLEKRVTADIHDLAVELNTPGVSGPRMMPIPGEVVTELDAVRLLTGATAKLLAGGGVYGAEGAVWIGVSGQDDQVEAATGLMASLVGEPACEA